MPKRPVNAKRLYTMQKKLRRNSIPDMRKVGLGARDEGEARSLRQAEQFFEPSSSHLFDDGFGGSTGMDGCVLIPNRCQPVGCERRRQRSSNDPAKKAAACTADYSAFAITHQIIDHLRGDIDHVDEPKFKAMFETAAEVMGGLATAFKHYEQKGEAAWDETARKPR